METLEVVVSSAAVALRKESVDRNISAKFRKNPHQVALRKESVDRNMIAYTSNAVPDDASLSARRAWIEIIAW